MLSKPLVSGITIFLNEEKFIKDAVESVFAQTYDEWELLLVDDGSTDGSTAIALQYAKQYPGKVRYLEHDCHQNLGTSASRNKGVHNAKGKYIAFLDADDVWLPHKLKQQVAILESHPEAAMLYGLTEYWYSWTGNPEDIERDYVPKLAVQPNTLVKPPTLLILILRDEHIYPCTCSVLVRREVFEGIGSFEESFRGLCEDEVFFAKVQLKATVFVAGECWDRYRQHPDSMCATALETEEDSIWLVFLNWLEEYLSKQRLKDTEVWRIVQTELRSARSPMPYRMLESLRHAVRQTKGLVKLVGRWMGRVGQAQRSSER